MVEQSRRRILLWLGASALAFVNSNAAHASTEQYGYDVLGRLVSVTRSDGTSDWYVYDEAGNRRFVVRTDGTFSATTRTYNSGAGTETAPAGARLARIRVYGGGGAGGKNTPQSTSVGGGGGGGYCEKYIAVTGGNSMTYSVAAAVAGRSSTGPGTFGNPSTASGTVAGGAFSLTANGGHGGSHLTAGPGGTATGGDVNLTGGDGRIPGGQGGACLGPGGGAGTALNGSAPGGGGAGRRTTGASGAGAAGRVEFFYV